jgi:hypothetical protein
MSIEKFSNCFASEEEVYDFFSDHIDRDVWFAAEPDLRRRILITATIIFDRFPWVGHALEEGQPLAFPRDGLYYDRSKGKLVAFKPDTLPRAVLVGFLELCLHLLKNPGIIDATPSIGSFRLGPISMDNIKGVQVFPDSIYVSLKPFFRSNGGAHWWRAN